jgi:hypothetical protein
MAAFGGVPRADKRTSQLFWEDTQGGGSGYTKGVLSLGIDPLGNVVPLPLLAYDAFGRERMAQPLTLFDSKLLYDKKPIFWDESITNGSGNATSTHSAVDASVTMHVEAGDTIIRQTKTHYNYQPSKAQEIYMTANLLSSGGGAGVVARVGAFNATDGVFFEYDEGTVNIVERKNGTDTRVASANWNVDPLDGTGPSGVTLDPSKTQILYMDFEWLGVGSVRYGIFNNGRLYICHATHHANIVETVYMSTPNLPLRYEVSSTGSTVEMQQICCVVLSNGGQDENGVIRVESTEGTSLSASAQGVIFGVIGIRLKSTHLDMTAYPLAASLISSGNGEFEWMVVLNPTVAGSPTFADFSEVGSAIQTAIGATANTVTQDSWSNRMAGGFASSQNGTSDPIQTAINLGSTIAGVADEIWLCVRPLTNNQNVNATLSWRELL